MSSHRKIGIPFPQAPRGECQFCGQPIIRDTEAEAKKVADAWAERNRLPEWRQPFYGTAEAVAEYWAGYLDLGFDHVYVDCPAPFDHETLERLATEVKPMLESR